MEAFLLKLLGWFHRVSPVNKSTAMKEPDLPTRTQAEDAPLSLGWGTLHSTSAPSWAAGLSHRMLPLAPDTAATKEQGEEKPSSAQDWLKLLLLLVFL